MFENSLSVSGKGSTCVSRPFPSMSAIAFSIAPLSDVICDCLSRYLSDLIMAVPPGHQPRHLPPRPTIVDQAVRKRDQLFCRTPDRLVRARAFSSESLPRT